MPGIKVPGYDTGGISKMSEACTHDCGNCSSDCGERTAPQSLNNDNNKGVKKVIAVVSGKGGVGNR